MRMVQEVLAPSVEHAEEADVGAEVLGICGNLQKTGGAGAEQETIEDLLVMERQRRQFVRKREDHMRVGNVQQLLAAGGEPLFPRVGLAFRAMAIPARVERDGLMATAITTVPVSAQGSGATALDGLQYFQMRPPQPGSVVLDEALALRANDVGHLEGGPAHFLCSFRDRFTWSGLDNPNEITLVTVEFIAHGAESELVITHERFTKTDVAQRYEMGWGTIATRFALYLACNKKASQKLA